MKLKAVVIVSLLLLILTVGAANAANDTISSDMSINDATSEKLTLEENSNYDNSNEELILDENSNSGCSTSSQIDEVKASSSQKNVLGADDESFYSLRQKINQASENSIITLDDNYTFVPDPYFPDEWTGGMGISKSLTIDGNGYTIDGSGKSRIFNISYYGVLTLKNLNIINGIAYDNGGAILNGGTLTIINCTFSNNDASYYFGQGGAIYNSRYKILTIINCTFSNNYAYRGGAIYDSGGTVKIVNCTFSNNDASYGGAINRQYYEPFTIINSKLYNNTLNSYDEIDTGSQIVLLTSDLPVDILPVGEGSPTKITLGLDTSFNGNLTANVTNLETGVSQFLNVSFADNEGVLPSFPIGKYSVSFKNWLHDGMIDAASGILLVYNEYSFTHLSDMIANATDSISLDMDYIYDGEMEAVSSEGIMIDHDLTINGAGHTIDAKELSRIFKITNDAHVVIENITFINAKEGNGTTIYNNGTLTLRNAIISNANSSDSGGAIYNKGTLTASNLTISNVTATGNGGLIYNEGTIEIEGATMSNSTSSNSGGAIYNKGNLTLSNVSITNTTADGNGGLIYNNGTMEISDASLNNSSSNDNGGAIYSPGPLTLSNVTISNSTAAASGGAIYSKGKLVLSNSALENNSANMDGGAIYSLNSLALSNVTISNSTAAASGGAIYSKAALEITNSTIENNSASIDGGAVYNYQRGSGCLLLIAGNTFTNNSADHFGGAIYNYKGICSASSTISCNNFTDNVAEDGSAVYVECMDIHVQDMGVPDNEFNNNNYTFNTWENGTEIHVTGNTFKDIQDAVDVANEGNIIYLDGITYVDDGGITIDKSLTFIGQENTVLDSNDFNSNIYIGPDTFEVTFKDISFTHFAAINSTGFNLNIINCTFDNITPSDIVYIDNPDSNITFINSTFSNNKLISVLTEESHWINYAVWIINSIANDKLVVDGCTFIDNNCTAINGAAIWCERTNDVIITNTTFKKNKLFDLIVLKCRNFTLADSTFEDNLGLADFISVNNQHRIRPGSNYVYFDAEVRVSNCSFIRNTPPETRGISIYQDYKAQNHSFDALIENCIFESNNNNIINYHIYDHLNSNQIIKNCTFINNFGDNAAISFQLCSPYVVDCVFENNSETCISGGGIEFNALNCSFKNNQAKGINISYFNTSNILDCVFENNTDRCINIEDRTYNAAILNCNFTNNPGGGIYIFNMDSESTVIGNCSFVNNSRYQGGAIEMVSNNTCVIDCVFENNYAIAEGGAIYMGLKGSWVTGYLYSNNVTFKNCSFNNNSAQYGGAIFANSSNSIIINCSFTNNSVDRGYGALLISGPDNILTNCSFIENFAYNDTSSGATVGAVRFTCDNGILANCSFMNNRAVSSHGALAFGGHNAILANCSFVNNSNTPVNDNAMGSGGTVLFYAVGSTIINCSFIGNSAHSYGGALTLGGANNTVENCNFTNNTVKLGRYFDSIGGAIYIGPGDWDEENYSSYQKIKGCVFINNSAIGDGDGYGAGGAIASEENNCTISDCIFDSNYATAGPYYYYFGDYKIGGGAIYFIDLFGEYVNYNSIISNCSFKSNKVNTSLNVMDEDYSLILSFDGYESYINAIYADRYFSEHSMTLDFYNLTYWDNGEELNTGELSPVMSSLQTNQQLTIEIYDSNGDLFLNMTQPVGDDGNLVYSYIDLPDGNYTYIAYHPDNDYYGYAAVEGNFSLNSSFASLSEKIRLATDNTTLKKDYAFDPENDTDFTDGIIIDKNITIYGEGHIIDARNLARIFNVTEDASLTLVNVTLINGQATDGGAIYSNGTLNIINSTFEGNNATNGGAVLCRNIMTITNSRFENNSASFFGIIYGRINTTINNSTVTNNHGERGTVFNGGNMTINDCNITNNYARVMGGGVCNFYGNATINNSTIKDNYAKFGGGIYTTYGDWLTLNDVRFIDNQVDTIYVEHEPDVNTTGAIFLEEFIFEIENISDFMEGTPITINVTETKKGQTFNGYVTIAIGDEKFSVELFNGTGSATIIPKLDPGTYTAELTLYETDKYEGSTATSNNFTITPKMVPTTISYQALTSVPGGDNYLIAVLKDNEGNPLTDKTITLSGDVEVNVTTNSNGKAIFDLSDLKPGDYNIVISYAGEEGLYPTNETVELTIPKVNTKLDVSLVDGVLTAILTEDGNPLANKNISVKVNDSNLSNLTDNDGKAVFDLNSLGLGSDDVIAVTYTDDDGFILTESVKVVEKINEIEVPINATINLTYEDGKAVATLTDLDGKPLANKNIAVSINGTPLLGAKTDNKGVYSINASGNTTVVVSYYSEGASVSSTLTINEIETIVNNTVYVNNTVEVEKIVYVNNTVEVPVEVEKIVYVNNTVEVPVEVEKIVYVNKTVEVPVEVEKIVYVNSTTDIPIDTEKIVYINQTIEVPVEVEKIVYVNETTEVPVEVEKVVYINNTVEVPVYINRTIEINNTEYITPNRTTTIIEYKNMVTTAVAKADGRVGEYFYVRLTDDKGKAIANKPIKIGFNGVVYNRTTDSDGRAKLQINLGYKGIYTFAIGFLGDDEYTGAFEVASITVNLQKPQLSTASKTYKASAKTKSLTATLKTVKGNPVSGKKISFTVNGKTYTGTTNAKGVATVKVSLSKKGTYSFTVKYAGDTQFATVSKKAKLTIK